MLQWQLDICGSKPFSGHSLNQTSTLISDLNYLHVANHLSLQERIIKLTLLETSKCRRRRRRRHRRARTRALIALVEEN